MAHILPSQPAGKNASTDWLILVGGSRDEITVRAASICEEQIPAGSPNILTILRDENGEVVFRAPAQSIAYIRRRQ